MSKFIDLITTNTYLWNTIPSSIHGGNLFYINPRIKDNFQKYLMDFIKDRDINEHNKLHILTTHMIGIDQIYDDKINNVFSYLLYYNLLKPNTLQELILRLFNGFITSDSTDKVIIDFKSFIKGRTIEIIIFRGFDQQYYDKSDTGGTLSGIINNDELVIEYLSNLNDRIEILRTVIEHLNDVTSKKYKIFPDILKYLSTNITEKISNFQGQKSNSNESKIDGYIVKLNSLQSKLSAL